MALDRQGNLYVTDSDNDRVVVYPTPLATHEAAIYVIGQPDFVHSGPNAGGLASGLDNPFGLTLDGQDDLFVADSNNNRVLEYNDPLHNDFAPDHVFGQPSFITNTANIGGLGAAGLDSPTSAALDANGDLYVADTNNNRVLEYSHPLSNQTADHVFGQPDFIHKGNNQGGLGAASLHNPASVTVDSLGNLYIADFLNNRVLEYDVPLAHDLPALAGLSPATVAAGSPDFTLTVDGLHFVANSVVRWNGTDLPTHYWSSAQLTVDRALRRPDRRRSVPRHRLHPQPGRRSIQYQELDALHPRGARHHRRPGAGPARLRRQRQRQFG